MRYLSVKLYRVFQGSDFLQKETHFGAIDAMRGVAAICVAIFHYPQFFMPQAGIYVVPVALTDIPFGSIFYPLYTNGEDFVRLFWVISGFVFAHVYRGRDTTTTAREFAVARFARLYPLHVVTLLIVAALQVTSFMAVGYWQVVENNGLEHFILQIFLMSASLNIVEGNSFNVPIWSVSAEIFIYVAFFFTLTWTKKRPLGGAVILAILSYLALLARPTDFIISNWVFTCGVFFFAGNACYALYEKFADQRAIYATLVAGGAGLAAVGFYIGNADLALFAICCTTILALAFLQHWTTVKIRVLQFLGNISYSLYLVHIPIQILVLLIADLAFGGSRAFANSHFALPLYLLSSIWLAHVVHVRFEKPVGAWLRRRLTRSAQRHPSAT